MAILANIPFSGPVPWSTGETENMNLNSHDLDKVRDTKPQNCTSWATLEI